MFVQRDGQHVLVDRRLAVWLLTDDCAANQVVVDTNRLGDGSLLALPAGASLTGTIAVTGANASLMPQVRTGLMQ
ncbi:hypothetical protein [Burkholderia sp. BE17]|uniref:hypothetical protein n=1 Tax=Burkholderia sp. BE17 TaxID=2656644 RepID=UPI001D120918|nr:hypothetical protein [Burkholderia sp. BE17]